MVLERINLQHKLEDYRNNDTSPEDILEQVKDFLTAEQRKEEQIIEQLQTKSQDEQNDLDFDLLDANRIFHISHIKQLCIDYRLRFLPSRFFRSKVPAQALLEIKRLEEDHGTTLKDFHLMAPSKNFKLESADDPLLFTSMGNDYYYLIHKWGKDLHPLRKLLVWPLKTIENLVVFTVIFSFLFTFVLREVFFARYQETSQFIMLFLFTFKSMVGLLVFYGVALGKNFNQHIWNSKYYNA